MFTNELPFFGVGAGFAAARLGDGEGDGDGDASTVGLGLAARLASAGATALRDLIVSVIPIRSTAATTAAINRSDFFDFAPAPTETETLGNAGFATTGVAER